MGVLGEYHRAIGALVHAYEGTLERFTGDGIMVFFNDPIQCDDAAERAVRMALEPGRRERACRALAPQRSRPRPGNRYRPGLRDPRRDRLRGPLRLRRHRQCHNLAARLCSDAGPWQVLVTDRVLAATEHVSVAEMVGDVQPKDSAARCGSTTSARSTTGG